MKSKFVTRANHRQKPRHFSTEQAFHKANESSHEILLFVRQEIAMYT